MRSKGKKCRSYHKFVSKRGRALSTRKRSCRHTATVSWEVCSMTLGKEIRISRVKDLREEIEEKLKSSALNMSADLAKIERGVM